MVPPEPPASPAPPNESAAAGGGSATPGAAGPATSPAPAGPAPLPPPPRATVPAAPASQKSTALTHIAPALSLVLGSLVLLPATTGQLIRPYQWELLLPTFVVLASLAAVLLIISALLAAFASASKPSQVVRGLGSVVGLVALAVLVGFVTANICDSLFSTPKVLNIRFAPMPLVAGKVAEADLEVLNKSAKPVHYAWRFNGHAVAGARTAYLRLPDSPGRYPVDVALRLAPPVADVDTGASAPATDAGVSTFRTWIDVVAGPTPPPPPPIVAPCCKGETRDQRKQKSSTGKAPPASDPKPGPGRR